MKSRRNRRRMVRRGCLDELAERPPQRRARAELDRVVKILESLPAKLTDEGRSV